MKQLWAFFRFAIILAVAVAALILMCLTINGYTDEFFGEPGTVEVQDE